MSVSPLLSFCRPALIALFLSLAACGMTAIQNPYYNVAEVGSFKTYGAPDRVMLLEMHGAVDGMTNADWARILSNRGFAPRLTFVDDAENPPMTSDGTKAVLRPQYRLVAVIHPTQASFRDTMCQNPVSAAPATADERTAVRFTFCAGDSGVSEVRVDIANPVTEQELDSIASPLIQTLFPHPRPGRTNRGCGGILPPC
ncbi:MAG: hypothetical protein ABID63_12350 [Pseudomonadota bacterium]